MKKSEKLYNSCLKEIKEGKKSGKKLVTIYTTNLKDYKKSVGNNGFGSSSLKPSILEVYKKLFTKFDITTNLVSFSEKKVEWIVKIK